MSRQDARSLSSNRDKKKSIWLFLPLVTVAFLWVRATGKCYYLPTSLSATNILHEIYNIIICISSNIII